MYAPRGLAALSLLLIGCANVARRRPADVVALSDVDPSIVQEIRYAGDHNFLGRPVRGYLASECLLTRKAALALHAVQTDLRPSGLALKVYDCYRPQAAVDDFISWAGDISDTKTKREFYPLERKSDLFKDGYIAEKSSHSRGSTVDLTLVPFPPPLQPEYRGGEPLAACTLPSAQRFPDSSLDMGTGYDCFDPLAHTVSPDAPKLALQNRLLLRSAMERHGFRNLPVEWWHYTLVDEPYPATYFDFEVR